MRGFIVIVILGFLATFTAAGKFKLNPRERLTRGTNGRRLYKSAILMFDG